MRFAEAEWRPVPNFAPGGMTVLGLCPHVIVGSLSGADATFHNKNPNQRGGRRSAHFGVGKDGRLLQWVDTRDRAWAQAAGNPFYVSAECEGLDSEPHTPAQVTSLARLLAWLHETDSVPFAVVDHPGDRGVISHRNGGAAWGGHSCPGDQRHAQRGEIVARAAHLVDPPLPVPGPVAPQPAPGPAAPPVHVVRNGRPYMQHTVIVTVDRDGNGLEPTNFNFAGAIVQNRAIANPRMPPQGNGRYKIAQAAGLDTDGKLDVVVMGADPSPSDTQRFTVPILVDIPD